MGLLARCAQILDGVSQTHPTLRLQGKPSKKSKVNPSTTKTVHFEVNLDECDEGELGGDSNGAEVSGSEMEEEGEPDEFFDVLDILDGRAEPLSDDEPPAAPPRQNETSSVSPDEEEEPGDDEDDQGIDPESKDQFMPSDDEADVGALRNLGQFISDLDLSTKRKASENEGAAVAEDNVPRKKRKLLKEHNEAGAENEFAASGGVGFGVNGIPLYSDNLVL